MILPNNANYLNKPLLFRRSKIGTLLKPVHKLLPLLKLPLLHKFMKLLILRIESVNDQSTDIQKVFDLIKQKEEVVEPYRAKNAELSDTQNLKNIPHWYLRSIFFLRKSAIESRNKATLLQWLAVCLARYWNNCSVIIFLQKFNSDNFSSYSSPG